MNRRILVSLIALVGLAGCAPTTGVVTSATGPEVGSIAPDVQYVSADGRQANFNKARFSVALVVFLSPEAANCCWVEPNVVNLADQFLDLPVTVAQFSLPKGKCSHGGGCVEVCNLRKGGLVSLCDAQRLAWNAYGKPAPGSLFLIGADNKILMKGSLSDPKPIVEEARRLGEAEKSRYRDESGG